MSKERFKVIPAVYLFLEQDGKILLSRRLNTGYEDGNYGLVSGHLEGDEASSQALVREAKEEAGIDLKEQDLICVHVMHRRSPPGKLDERMDIFFTANHWNGEIKNMEPHKCSDLSWFNPDKLPENIIPYIREVIGNIHRGNFFSQFGW